MSLWELIEPLIPQVRRRHRYPGRKRLDDRQVLTGILFVLRTGIPWEYLPQEMGCGSGMTCWRRLREWQEAGVWQRLHQVLLMKLQEAELIDWSRAAIDSSHVRALGGRKDWPEPRRPRATRFQAPPDRLRPRHAIGLSRSTPVTPRTGRGRRVLRGDLHRRVHVVQATASDEMRARAIATWAASFVGVLPVGGLITAGLASWLGAGGAVAVDGAGTLIAGAVVVARRPEVAWLGCPALPRACVAATQPEAVALEREASGVSAG